jgi:hypothetical protein
MHTEHAKNRRMNNNHDTDIQTAKESQTHCLEWMKKGGMLKPPPIIGEGTYRLFCRV